MMVQKFLPAIAQGDKRVLVIGGKPFPIAWRAFPQGGEVRQSTAAGGKGRGATLSDADRPSPIFGALAARGLLWWGWM